MLAIENDLSSSLAANNSITPLYYTKHSFCIVEYKVLHRDIFTLASCFFKTKICNTTYYCCFLCLIYDRLSEIDFKEIVKNADQDSKRCR